MSLISRLDVARAAVRGCDVVAGAPVPIRPWLADSLAEVIEAEPERALTSCLVRGQGGWSPLQELRRIRRLEEFPNLVISADYGNLFNRRFHQREVIEGGAFRTAQPGPVPPAVAAAGLVDPLGVVALYALAPFVFLVDQRRLNGRRPPRTWAELLEPEWRGEIVVGGWKRPDQMRYHSFNKFLLLALHQEAGTAGVARFAANVAALVHSVEMPRLAGSGSSLGSVYVLPWSLADICPRRQVTEVIWPEDGALAYPLWLVAKAAAAERLAPVTRFLFGARLGRYLNHNRYPALSPLAPAGLPPGAPLKWPGWEVIRARATAAVVRRACTVFFDHWSPGAVPAGRERSA